MYTYLVYLPLLFCSGTALGPLDRVFGKMSFYFSRSL